MTSSSKSDIAGFHYIAEGDEFLTLFPHRFDFIFAEHPQPKTSPNWQTERRYPLSDRLLQQSSYLYGVRFGATTRYCLLDIDTGSPYHPQQDVFAISRIRAALEPLGLIASIACTSSDSSGIHLYLPFQVAQNSWEVAIAVSALLENAGFCLKAGQLEIFPNPKSYVAETPTLFNAHRLPMQIGSYLLNEDLQPIWSDRSQFTQQWQFSQQRNDLNSTVLKQIIKQTKRKSYQVSGKADKFINDLNAEIELGWTGAGQTNRLLGRITMRCYIFHHVLFGGEPLAGKVLADKIVETARSLPGYQQWCRHQHEIEKKAAEWARCIENSTYFPYGTAQGKNKPKSEPTTGLIATELSWNQQQSEAARDRISKAIAHLLETNSLPASTTARFQALTQCGIGGGSLYRHRDLWHPDHLWKTSPDAIDASDPIVENQDQTDVILQQSFTSLLSETGGNALSEETCSNSTLLSLSLGNNRSPVQLTSYVLKVCLATYLGMDEAADLSKREMSDELPAIPSLDYGYSDDGCLDYGCLDYGYKDGGCGDRSANFCFFDIESG